MSEKALEAAADTLSEALRERSLTEIRRLPDGDYWVEARLGTVYEAILDSLLGDLPEEAVEAGAQALVDDACDVSMRPSMPLSETPAAPGYLNATRIAAEAFLRSLRGGLGGGA